MRRINPLLLLAVLVLAAGFGAGLGLSEAPPGSHVGLAVPPGRTAPSATGTVPSAAGGSAPAGTRVDGAGALRPSPTSLATAVVRGRFVVPVTMGGLVIDPAPPQTPPAPLGLDQPAATTLVGYTSGVGVLGPADARPTVGFGLVTVRGVAPPAGTSALDESPAWVGIVLGVNQGGFSCPAMRTSSAPGPLVPEDRAVLFTGAGGRGAVLYDTGGSSPCGGSTVPPSLREATATVPVRWQQQGPAGLVTTVSYQAPECARTSGVATGGNVHTGVYHAEVDVTFPFARSGCDAVKTFTTTVTVFPPDAGPGAPPPPTTVVLLPSTAPDAVPASLVGPVSQSAAVTG